jgi:hypothetical protein
MTTLLPGVFTKTCEVAATEMKDEANYGYAAFLVLLAVFVVFFYFFPRMWEQIVHESETLDFFGSPVEKVSEFWHFTRGSFFAGAIASFFAFTEIKYMESVRYFPSDTSGVCETTDDTNHASEFVGKSGKHLTIVGTIFSFHAFSYVQMALVITFVALKRWVFIVAFICGKIVGRSLGFIFHLQMMGHTKEGREPLGKISIDRLIGFLLVYLCFPILFTYLFAFFMIPRYKLKEDEETSGEVVNSPNT